jgi:hypothetical protein
MGLRIGIPLFLVAFTVDFATKSAAVRWDEHLVVHHVSPEPVRRLLMTAAAIAVAALLSELSVRRPDLGRPWGAWIGVPLLAAGVLGNGSSSYLWPPGVPDFIPTGKWVANVADFEIYIGSVGGVVALMIGALVVFALERRAART